MDLDHVQFIYADLPCDKTEDTRDRDGDLLTNDTYPNPDCIYDRDDGYLETWECPICKEFNGKGE